MQIDFGQLDNASIIIVLAQMKLCFSQHFNFRKWQCSTQFKDLLSVRRQLLQIYLQKINIECCNNVRTLRTYPQYLILISKSDSAFFSIIVMQCSQVVVKIFQCTTQQDIRKTLNRLPVLM